MLKIILTDIDNKEYIYINPLSLTLSRESAAPADSLTVLFASDNRKIQFSDICVYDGKSCVFKGIVDEQIETISENGCLLEINARSMAALLLDNEAMPQNCSLPNMQLFMERNFSGLGFKKYIGEDISKSGSISIDKGTSEWSVLERYCKGFLGVTPSVNETGIIDISGGKPELVIIPNKGEIRLMSLKHMLKRCRIISEYRIRASRGNGYEMIIDNEKAKRLNIRAVRYLNAVDSKNDSIASCCSDMEDSNNSYETVEIVVSGRVLARVGDYVVISGYDFGNLCIESLRYELDGDGEKTRLVMYIEEDNNSVDSGKYSEKEFNE